MPLETLMAALPSVKEDDIDLWVDCNILYRHTVPSGVGTACMEVVELALPVDAVAHFASNIIESRASH